jgi:hypothetical protein
LSSHVLKSPPDVHVPEEPALARQLLLQLYEKNADEAICSGFAKFAAVLGTGSDEMGFCYMSEINLGMDGMSRHPERIKEAISFFEMKLADDRHQVSDLHYTIGNAFHALRNLRRHCYITAVPVSAAKVEHRHGIVWVERKRPLVGVDRL